MTGPLRVVVGQLWQESHSFNPVPTTTTDFVVERGDELLERADATGTGLGGVVAELRHAGADAIPSVAARARPGGSVEDGVFEAFCDEIASTAADARPDAVVLDLHGSMLTPTLEDPESRLVARVRAAVGPRVPIGVALDLHAHVTPDLVQGVDVCSAYKTNPHVDVEETGARVAAYVLRAARGEFEPVLALAKVPMLMAGLNGTADEPLASIHRAARELTAATPSVCDVSVFNVHGFLDVAGAGQAVLALADRHAGPATEIVRRLAQALWDARADFTERYPSLDEALALERAGGHPLVVGDRGDRVLAGAPGDGTFLVERFMEPSRRHYRAVVPLTDPDSVAHATATGVGGSFALAVGGRLSQLTDPLPVTGVVTALGDGIFEPIGPLFRGSVCSMGRTALVQCDNVTLMLTERAGLTHDPAAFTSQGVALEAQDVVVSKSGHHFKVAFAPATCVVVDTPGMSSYRPGHFLWKRLRPIFPEDDLALPEDGPRTWISTKPERTAP